MARGTVYVDARLKDERGNVVVFGRVLLGLNDIINPRDLGLSTIKSMVFTPWDTLVTSIIPGSAGSLTGKDYGRSNPRQFSVMVGSIGSLNSLSTGVSPGTQGGNYVRVNAYRVIGRGTVVQARGAYIGTHTGSMRASYTAVGR